MSRQKAQLQVNSLTGGFVTEFNVLKEQPNISYDELNMTINNDESRSKRLGFDLEDGYRIINTSISQSSGEEIGISQYLWENAGGVPENKFQVIQIGNHISVFNTINNRISSNQLYSAEIDTTPKYNNFSFASVDGILVIATGQNVIITIKYDPARRTFTRSGLGLLVRDLFGVQANISGKDLTTPDNLQIRPVTINDTHLYNLRNQTFSGPRPINRGEDLQDTVTAFKNDSGFYPSNADQINPYLYADPNDSDGRTLIRYFSSDHYKSPPDSNPSPKGFFIINALERGTSRLAKEAELRSRWPQLNLSVNNLPIDRTPGGAKVVEEYAGRIFYAGFSGDVEGGDLKSPRLSSYVLFSLLVQDPSDINKCYQLADPTSSDDPDIADTDGGFIRLDGAYNVSNMVNQQGSLFIFAENGVWRISGTDDTDFRATGYHAERISDRGVVGSKSVVNTEAEIMYWSQDGIYRISRGQTRDWVVESMTEKTIKSFYNNISKVAKASVVGSYDRFTDNVSWLYNPATSSTSYELVFNRSYGSFTKNSVDSTNDDVPTIVSTFKTIPYTTNENDEVKNHETTYLVTFNDSGMIKYTFGMYKDDSYVDWNSIGPTNYPAYIITGRFMGDDGRANKQVPYLHIFFRKTENGFNENLEAKRQSSCLISSQWSWSNSVVSNKWSFPRQAYRHTRPYFPSGPNDTFDTGFEVLKTKNKIRGWGNSLSIKFEAEDGKALCIYGWGFDITMDSEE